MKLRFYGLVLITLMCSAAFAAKPVIVKDKFTTQAWFAYVPADSSGEYWTKWYMSQYNYSDTPGFYAAKQVFFGKCYAGRQMNYGDRDGNSVAWTEYTEHQVVYFAKNTQNAWIEFVIPEGHNYISVITARLNSTYGSFGVTLNGSTAGLLRTVVDCNADAGELKFEEIPLTYTANGGRLRFTVLYNKYATIVGVRSFNTSLLASPAQAKSGDATQQYGNDLFETFTTGQPTDDRRRGIEVAGYTDKVIYANIVESTLSWKPTGQSTSKWTAVNATHADDAHARKMDSNSTLYIDGTNKGNMYTLTRGSIYEGNSITIKTKYFMDYNGGGTQDGVDPNGILYNTFTQSGFTTLTKIQFLGATTVDVWYMMSLPLDDPLTKLLDCYIQPDQTANLMESFMADKYTNQIRVVPRGEDWCMTASSIGPTLLLRSKTSDDVKSYFVADTASLDAAAAGTTWAGGGHISIVKKGVNDSGVITPIYRGRAPIGQYRKVAQ